MKKLSFLVSMLTALFMVACTSNELPEEPGSEAQGDRVLKINVHTLATKTEHPGADNGSFTLVEDGMIYFFKDGGNAVFAYRLTGDDITALKDATSPTYKEITITGVPLTATKVAMVANLLKTNRTSYPPFAGNTLTTLKEFTFKIEDQQPVGGVSASIPVAEVVMSGEADIIVDNSVTPAKNTAKIDISPVLSRLEVGAVRCKNVAGTSGSTLGEGQITKFRLKGVFIPNHYTQGSVWGIGTGATVKPTDVSLYSTSFPNSLFDYYKDPSTLKKNANNYFAYHTFPSVNDLDMPNIVVAVDNVWFIDKDQSEKSWNEGNTQYFTVEKFKIGTTTDYLKRFEPAKIYRIKGTDPETTYIGVDKDGNVIMNPETGKPAEFDENGNPVNPGDPVLPADGKKVEVTLPGGSGGIEFGIEDLTDKPYDKNKTVQCNITILPWTLVEITPAK